MNDDRRQHTNPAGVAAIPAVNSSTPPPVPGTHREHPPRRATMNHIGTIPAPEKPKRHPAVRIITTILKSPLFSASCVALAVYFTILNGLRTGIIGTIATASAMLFFTLTYLIGIIGRIHDLLTASKAVPPPTTVFASLHYDPSRSGPQFAEHQHRTTQDPT